MKKIFFPLLMAVLTLSTLSWQACKKHKDELGPVREFMPSGDIKTVNGQTSVSITWKAALNSDSSNTTYTVIVSKDSTFANGPEFTFTTDTSGIILYDTQIAIKTTYYAQIKTNGSDPSLDSKWLASGAFKILGEQIILPIADAELKHTSVTIRWTHSDNVTKLVLTPTGGSAQDIALTPTDVDSNFKLLENLTPLTPYHISIYEGTKEVGYTDFTTKAVPIYAFVLTPDADLVTVLDTCSPGILIGLDPGTYESTNTLNNLTIKNKMVSLASTSNNPNDTKVYFKEITLKGDGAGVSLKGIEFDGSVATALYFINLTGLNADGDAAAFTKVKVENCILHNYNNCFMRANRASATAGHTIDSIYVNNCIVKDNTFLNAYSEFQLTKLQFGSLTVTNTTFSNVGVAMLEMTTTLPAGAPIPKVMFDHMTINNLGGSSKRLFDANANPVQLTITNNIIANAPRGTAAISAEFIRATGSGTSVNFSYNNTFKLTVGSVGTPLSIPASTLALTTQTANLTTDLGWTATTTSFIVPAGSPLLTNSSTGGLIGDPRWQ